MALNVTTTKQQARKRIIGAEIIGLLSCSSSMLETGTDTHVADHSSTRKGQLGLNLESLSKKKIQVYQGT